MMPVPRALTRALALLVLAAAAPAAALPVPRASAPVRRADAPVRLETVVFAGGCFWGVQAVFQHVKGVVSATSGYAGGTVPSPTYEAVTTGRTGHAEVVRVVYDPATVSYATLLEVFFTVVHDPTQLDRQGPDRGTQYRSAVFVTTDAQRAETERVVKALEDSRRFASPVVTRISTLEKFYPAESYHQDYATRHPDSPYIRYHDAPKIEALRTRHPALWSERMATSEMR